MPNRPVVALRRAHSLASCVRHVAARLVQQFALTWCKVFGQRHHTIERSRMQRIERNFLSFLRLRICAHFRVDCT